ncbi:hypothetical protein EJ078_05010 [Mesorhizobium sp. M1A.F.Ca.IN.022.06.1.1]|uniref:hypothetical protein n=1 Tax=Mesorhizobium sp. M1A.F.Ca.IN.022.06.1.1 TaxID=2493680 RepID=UPI000F753B07|nr:hypothetical protein [Mesorhizobium sp. M1A.F.Ca.IN.022.06.1.1]AZO58733.1 hypothetical protein EJ078_05010 [Mesorhizobium sp. M1A.F.Ca.IN.022.06.1.1]
MIRYFALAFIFFQVATTAALATQVVLFEGETAAVLPLTDPASAAPTLPSPPKWGDDRQARGGRDETPADPNLSWKQSQTSPTQ